MVSLALTREKDEQGNEHVNDHERERRAEHEQASPGPEDDKPEAGLADVSIPRHRRERGYDAGADERDPEDTGGVGVDEKDYGDGEDAAQPDQRNRALEVVALERVLLPPQSRGLVFIEAQPRGAKTTTMTPTPAKRMAMMTSSGAPKPGNGWRRRNARSVANQRRTPRPQLP